MHLAVDFMQKEHHLIHLPLCVLEHRCFQLDYR